MILIEKTEAVGWGAAIRGMRNPMNSWAKSDSGYAFCADATCSDCSLFDGVNGCRWTISLHPFSIGPNDLALMKKLAQAGTDHRKFMRMIVVYCDITAPLYWWKEFTTYRAGVKPGDSDVDPMDIEMNSCSTMHKIHAKEFTLEDFSCEHLYNIWEEKDGSFKYCLQTVLAHLNCARKKYLETGAKGYWWQMIQLLPTSYNQKRTVMLNYEVLSNIYKSRKNHKLDEWRELCKWIESLPYSQLITGKEGEADG